MCRLPGRQICHVQDDAIFRGAVCPAAAAAAGVCAAAAGVVGVVAGILLGGDRRARAPGASLVFA